MGMSENGVYSQWNSHLVGIMIINHWVIGYTIFRQTQMGILNHSVHIAGYDEDISCGEPKNIFGEIHQHEKRCSVGRTCNSLRTGKSSIDRFNLDISRSFSYGHSKSIKKMMTFYSKCTLKICLSNVQWKMMTFYSKSTVKDIAPIIVRFFLRWETKKLQ